MQCKNCTVTELMFEVRLEGEVNQSILPAVVDHLQRRKFEIVQKDQILLMGEESVQDFVDFCKDHMKPEEVSFRIDQQDWRPLAEIETVFEMDWIDEVIRNERLFCHYQPIVDQNEEVFAYELLSRFKNEDGSLIYPNVIFDAARNRGRLYALDRVCRMTAVRFAAVLKNKKAFINFIPTSIYLPEYCLQSTTGLANELGVDPTQLVFEVVETEKVEDIDHLKKILAYYQEKGFDYALDDVGEGYSTLEMLEDIRPQYMKLDIQYVQGVASNSAKQQVAVRFLDKAVEVGAVPLAEGVEEREDFEWLKQRGYQLFQGYLFGKPGPSPLA